MFGITEAHLKPITELTQRFPPPAPADTTKLGAWGIVFLCCGAMARRNPRWVDELMSSTGDMSPTDLISHLQGKSVTLSEQYAEVFSQRIRGWCNDEFGMRYARQQLAPYREKISPKAFSVNLAYVTLAIWLNSHCDAQLAEMVGWEDRSRRPEFGWPELFFAAGLILSDEKSVEWRKMVSAIHGMSGPFKEQVTEVFEHYAGKSIFSKPGVGCIYAHQIKKGMRLRLRNGWEAIAVSECEENVIQARVFGDFTETGSVYVHTIESVQIDGKWIKFEMTHEQRQFADELHGFFGCEEDE